MATAKLTRDYVRNLKPSTARYEIRDTDLAGFMVRVSPGGKMVYYCTYDRGKKVPVGRADVLAPAEAREVARRIMADYSRGIDPLAEKRRQKAVTLRAYLDGDYGAWARSHYGDGERLVKTMKASFPELLDKRLDEITPWLVEKWRANKVKEGLKASSINRQVNPLKALMRRAKEFGVIDVNPLEGAVKLKREDSKGKPRYLHDDEEARLMAVLEARDARLRAQRDSANQWRAVRGYKLLPSFEGRYADHLLPMIVLSLNTGARRGELFNLKWRDVDLGTAMLTVEGEGSKTGETRHVPLNAAALGALKTWGRDDPERYVFPGENGGRITTVQTAWEKTLAEAKVADFRWHDMRHTFASRLVMAGVDLNTVRELLGHSDMKMTLRYAHLAPHVKVDAVARLDRTG